ncbi:MAG: type II toxin-antitoxin system HicB family antitoxin [Oscillospiraceae bacterium]
MSKYVFPAVFEKEDVGFSIYFPDLETCFTQGNDLEDGLNMANDVLCMTLYDMEVEGAEIPKPTDPMTIKNNEKSFVTLIGCDTLEYRKFHNNKAVKKTLTVPQWLDEMAMQENVNFSQTLQQALIEKLKISN